MTKKSNLIGGSLLIAGTSIGGGILALPVLTSQGGFIPSLVIYFFCWLFMACTGLLFLEIASWMDKESNIVSMADRTLGNGGKFFAWIVYLFLFYCLTLAYIVGCGDLVSQLFTLSEWKGSLIFVLIFAPIVYAGARSVGRVNMFLMLGLGVSYALFIFLGYQYVNIEFLKERNWSYSFFALPISFAAFAYQGTVPSLIHYMHDDMRRARLAILIGSFLPLIAYVIWQGLILGIIPSEELLMALKNGDNAVAPLKNFVNSSWIYVIGQFFAFFALVTSFLGVTLGLRDFLADGFKVKKDSKGRIWLCALVFIPPLLIAFLFPHIFLIALDYAGGFGCALLLGLLPILMVWAGRYHLGLKSKYALPGGRIILILLLLFVLFELMWEGYFTFNRL